MNIDAIVCCLIVGDEKGPPSTVCDRGTCVFDVNEKGSYFMTPEQISTRKAFVHFSRCIIN